MKKLFALILICALVLSLAGCNKKDEDFTPEMVDTSGMDFGFTERDISGSYDTTVTTVSEANITITSGGTYIFTGDFTGITVDADGEKIQLVLSGADVSSSEGPAIYIKAAKKVFITLAEGTENALTDGAEYSEELVALSCDGCIFSKADLTINGSGKLTVSGNYKHGIVSKDDLIIAGATLTVTSQSTGIEGKDCLKAKDADITVTSGTDGIKSTNTEDSDRGFVFLENCKLNITSDRDSVQASRVIKILSGEINIKSGIGVSGTSESYKGIKSNLDIIISGGNFTINSKDDAIHANNSISISGGDFTIASGDDGIHADTDLLISDGSINITESYEGIEATNIMVSGGNISVVASDDGFNAAGGNDGGSGGQFGQDPFSGGTGTLTFSGGYVFVNAYGDGLDSNGSLAISGGTILVSGPTNSGNGTLDYGGDAKITGGILMAYGSSGMAQSIASEGDIGVIGCTFSTVSGSLALTVINEDGEVVATFAPPKYYSSAVIVAPGIKSGGTYSVYAGGSVSGTDANGFATSGTLEGGTLLGTIEASNGYSGGGTPGGGPGGGRPGGRPY